jgi:L-threonylcarbamoyladenylate synthase
MKTISYSEDVLTPALLDEIASVLKGGGLVCLPCVRSYRILADLTNPAAVTRLLQSKSRTARKPSLVFVANHEMLARVVDDMGPLATSLAKAFWPGPLTLLLPAHSDLPRKVVKQLGRGDGRLGVRIPTNRLVREVVAAFGAPLLASSANKQKKSGAASPAQVRKNFTQRLDLFLDAGDLTPGLPSTVVDVDSLPPVVVRPGAIPEEAIHKLAGGVA